ncbi:hypothetical protein L5515_018607 [Caenorhabditis briggsae]|uniref:Uncharacterized protein n=1 Tax=Caenorhabditis briggsae TaxID=6238 RepID=A0AAE9FGY7_CAEBR|nr:hypothetical protein L5515_018607 [Caenorhabditis briggsae]
MGSNISTPSEVQPVEVTEEMTIQKTCEEAAGFRIGFYTKIKAGWNSQALNDTKMIHYLYRIFYMAPNDQEVQVFEWHNFFDIHHDFPMRVHIDNNEDHKKCASMAEIIAWFSKPEKDRNALRRLGKAPNKIYCLGCKTVEEKEFLSLMAMRKMTEQEKAASSSVLTISDKAVKRLGMSQLDVAVAARECARTPTTNPCQNALMSSVIGLPLRRSASALLFPVTDLLDQHCIKESKNNMLLDPSSWHMDKASSSYDLNKAETKPKKKLSRADFIPKIFVGGKNLGEPSEKTEKASNSEEIQRKNGTVDIPILKQSEAHKKSIAKRKMHERLLKASEWCRVTDEDKAVLVEIKVRQRLLLIQHYIRGWQDMGIKDKCMAKWLMDDITKPLHSRRFASFEYHHFIPSHDLQIITKLNKAQMEKYARNYIMYMQRVESLKSYTSGRGEMQKKSDDSGYPQL